jgi:glycosyltransferase involved in cell wall biosynthesis
MMLITVILCTRNRAESLQLTLDSLGQVQVPTGWEVELMIVDNGSNDATKSISLATRLSNLPIRYVSEPLKGKSHACNTALALAMGQIFLFTDDDVRVPHDWIEGMCRPILNGSADAVAGRVIFPANIEMAMSRSPLSSLRSWFASTETLDLNAPTKMVGANMAFHRRVLARIPGFDLELGPGAIGFGEETLFCRQMLEAGFKIAGAGEVAVEHHFDLTRLSSDSLIAIAQSMGRTHAFIFHHWQHQQSRIARLRLFLAKIIRIWTGMLYAITGANDGDRFLHVLRAEKTLAFYSEYLVQIRRPRKYTLRGLSPILVNPKA